MYMPTILQVLPLILTLLKTTSAISTDDIIKAETNPSLVPRIKKPNGVFVCDQPNWKGNCFMSLRNENNVNSCFKWAEIKSFGPDNGLRCDLYEGEKCMGEPFMKHVFFPGAYDTKKGGLRSWKCSYQL